MFVQQAKALEAFERIEAIQFKVHGCREISKEGWQKASWRNIKRSARWPLRTVKDRSWRGLQSAQNMNPMDSTLLGRTVVQVQICDRGICWKECHQATMGRHPLQKSSTQDQRWSHWTRLLSLHGPWTTACWCTLVAAAMVSWRQSIQAQLPVC